MRLEMAALSKMTFRVERKAIYILNITIYTNFERFLSKIPQDVLICVNETITRRYDKMFKQRAYQQISAENPWACRRFMRELKRGNPVVVALDTDQATFQAIARYAYLRKIDLIPVFAHERTVYMMDPLPKADPQTSLEQLQKFLFMSYVGRPDTGPVHLFNELLAAAQYYGTDRIICKDISAQVSYKDLLLNTYVLSRRLKRVIPDSSNGVGVFLPNSIGNVVTLFALFYNNQSPVMLNYSAGVQTILDACDTANLKMVLTSREFIAKGKLEAVDEALRRQYEVIYLEDLRSSISLLHKFSGLLSYVRRKRATGRQNRMILFTSGSEYKPRGIVLSHANIFANVQQTRAVIDFEPTHRILNAMPMFHSFGLTAGTFLPLLTGIQTYLYPTPLHYKRIPELVGEEESTVLFGTSSFLERYGQNATRENFASLRYAIAGAEGLKPEVEKFWLDKFHLQIMQGYGATETAPIMCLDTPLNHRLNSVGRLLPEISYRLMPVEGISVGGILQMQGPNLMEGYLLHGQGYIKQEGWYDTGDVVTIDENRFVIIVGRLKRFAKIAGEMVSLNLVEQLAAQVYGSSDFAAINVPDAKRGERIILTTTAAGLSLAPLRALVEQLGYSRMHVPSELSHISQFPLLGSGKTDYVALKALFETKL
ncbi:AMP-binding protein [Alicyclobacillus fodiniaquatilis]|uniref:AMP-binding protein n=1 Tax=Alicyclobacillus fodiniaquatilis TaxID=1661150 RepID=A0ABW4JGR1_9BACL